MRRNGKLLLLAGLTLLHASAASAWIGEDGQRNAVLERFGGQTGCESATATLIARPRIANDHVGTWKVSGCGKEATYLCRGKLCSQDSGMRETSRLPPGATAPAGPDGPRLEVQHKEKDGEEHLMLTATLPGEGVELRCVGAPGIEHTAVVLTIELSDGPATKEAAKRCPQMMVVDGKAMSLPKPRVLLKSDGSRVQTSFHMQLATEELQKLAKSRRIAGRSCDQRWQVEELGIQVLRELVMRFHEEMILLGITVPPVQSESPSTPTSSL